MAEYINMQQTEYDEVQTSLLTLHEEILKAEKEIRNEIWTLINYEGGLYVKGISSNIMDILLNMSLTVSFLQHDFNNSEQAITKFIASVVEADVAST